jgi:D-threo-aldose 1-dehydrogenase
VTQLHTRLVGSTGLRLTELAFGAASLGNLYRATSDDEASGAVTRAWECGMRYFDTAPHYGLGLSERRLGQALSAYPRSEYIVSTKVGRLLEPNPNPTPVDTDGFQVPGDLRRVWDFSRDGVRRSLDGSLQRLGTDHVDIVYAHDPDQFREGAAREALGALAQLRSEGVVRAIGVGTNSVDELPELLRGGLIDVVMLASRYTLLEQGGPDQYSSQRLKLTQASSPSESSIRVCSAACGQLQTPSTTTTRHRPT